MNEKTNLIFSGDSYKVSHHMFMEPGITETYDYLESRGGEYSDTTVFGMQALLKKYLVGSVVTMDDIEEAHHLCKNHFGRKDFFNRSGWEYIVKKLDGKLPLEISSLPEGLTVPVRVPLLTYKNTDPNCSWLPGYMETFLFELWYPITVSTLCRHIKHVIYDALKETGTLSNLDFMLSNFGSRGCSSQESVNFGSAAHLLHFKSTDSMSAIPFINKYYGNGNPDYMPGFSVAASEHSVMTQKGQAGEFEVVKTMFEKVPTGILAMVADSYNVFNFADRLGTEFKQTIINREGVTVLRPDSGPPIPTMLKIMWQLGEHFGWTINEKGYRVLGTDKGLGKIKVLQGDGNNYNAIYDMLKAFKGAKWSADNIATFGMGGALLQASTRDTQKMAIKLSSLTDSKGNWRSIYKDPITDPGKGSKAGRFAVTLEHDKHTGKDRYVTTTLIQGQPIPKENLLRPIYRNGDLLIHEDFETIRKRADQWMVKA